MILQPASDTLRSLQATVAAIIVVSRGHKADTVRPSIPDVHAPGSRPRQGADLELLPQTYRQPFPTTPYEMKKIHCKEKLANYRRGA